MQCFYLSEFVSFPGAVDTEGIGLNDSWEICKQWFFSKYFYVVCVFLVVQTWLPENNAL